MIIGPDGIVDGGRGILSSDGPYSLAIAFIVLQKSEKQIVFEEDVQDVNGKPPMWKEKAKLEGHVRR